MALITENPLLIDPFRASDGRDAVVVAGPGSSFTVPGLIVSEIVQALAKSTPVTRIEVDVNSDLITGLHRAPSLSAAHEPDENDHFYATHRAPANARQRLQLFRRVIGRDVATVIAYAWPGIDNSWIKQFVSAGRAAGALTVVVCASLPQPSHAKASSLAGTFAFADVILVGDVKEAEELRGAFGRWGPDVECHPALSLTGRNGRHSRLEITAFLPKDGVESLKTVLSAFDAIPEAWIHDYRLQVVMRYNDRRVADIVSDRYHREYVDLVGDQMTSKDLEGMVSTSSAIGIANPEVDSRVFSTAISSGIGTVVMGDVKLPKVGRGYVGGLLADVKSPASLHVALSHALRLGDLRFPNPSEWDGLARRLSPAPRQLAAIRVSEPAND
jgi:hypothetical protein